MQLVIIVLVCLVVTVRCYRKHAPNPVIAEQVRVYSQGFEISVPDNKKIDSVQFQGECLSHTNHLGSFMFTSKSAQDGYWTYLDTETVLTYGNVINYSLVITMNGMQHVKNNKFTVKYIDDEYDFYEEPKAMETNRSAIISTTTRSSSKTSDPPTVNVVKDTQVIAQCDNSNYEQHNISRNVNITLSQMKSLNDKMSMILGKIEGLEAMLRQVVVDNNRVCGNKLVLTGAPLHDTTNITDFVLRVLNDKLGLHDIQVVSISSNVKGIVFEVPTVFDKMRTLTKALVALKNSHLAIHEYEQLASEKTNRNMPPIKVDVRFGHDEPLEKENF